MTKVASLTDRGIVTKLKQLVADERKNVATQIVLLKEVKRRKLALELGYPSLTAFCEEELGLSKNQAWKRSQAAGVVEKAPEIFSMIASGTTSLAAVAIVAPKLTEKTKAEIQSFLPGKAKRDVEAFASNLNRDGTRSSKPQTVKRAFNLTLDMHAKLDHAARLLRQNKPDLTQEEVLDVALELLIEKRDPVRKAQRAERRKQKKVGEIKSETTSPGKGDTSSNIVSRYIPAATRHTVYQGFESRCSYRSQTGKRCRASVGLHVDHIKPFSHGGEHDVKNLRLMCPGHNRLIGPGRR